MGIYRITNTSLNPRKYQRDALEKAKEHERCVICLPTGTGKTLVGLMYTIHLLNEKEDVNRVLVLEPSRFLTEQIAEYYRKNSNMSVERIYGVIPKDERIEKWQKGAVVVATPHTAYNDIDLLDFDAVIVDECHHVTGEHAYAKLVNSYDFKYRLGLSATVPQSKEKEIKESLGEIFRRSWSDPDIRPHVPDWYGEVYDSEFDEDYKTVYRKLEDLREKYSGTPFAGLCSLAIRMLSRDGAIALQETLKKGTTMSDVLGPDICNDLSKCKLMHKLEQMKKVFEQHDFEKAIVFVDRVVLARKLEEEFRDLNPVLMLGRLHVGSEGQKEALDEARAKETRLIIATSAGEEGIDLPSADLLIVWSNTVSPIRFIQRLGRMMRKSKDQPDKLKIAAYIATPDTPDYSALAQGLYNAMKNGVDVAGIDLEALAKGTVEERVVTCLEQNPASMRDISEALKIGKKRVNKWLKETINRGKVFYFYTLPYDPVRKANALRNYKNGIYDEYLLDDLKKFFRSGRKMVDWRFDIENEEEIKRYVESGPHQPEMLANMVINRFSAEDRIYALQEETELIATEYKEHFESPPDFRFKVTYGFSPRALSRPKYYVSAERRAYLNISYKPPSRHSSKGTADEIYELLKSAEIVGKKVYLNFSSQGVYTGARISYDGRYSEDALKLVVRNAGWICWNVKRMNDIISGD